MYGGIKSSVFTMFVDKGGIAQNIAKTTAPYFKGAFVFGAMNTTFEYASTNLKKKVQNDLFENGLNLYKELDGFQIVLNIATRYAVAKLCNRYFGTQITNKFVHIYTASDIIKHTSNFCCGSEIGTTPFILNALACGVFASISSILFASPSFASAFCFGFINFGMLRTLSAPHSKIHSEVKNRLGEDLRLSYISHVALRVIAIIASNYLTAKICSRFLNLQIPRSHLILNFVFTSPLLLIVTLFDFIESDKDEIKSFLNSLADLDRVTTELRNSSNPAIPALITELEEFFATVKNNSEVFRSAAFKFKMQHGALGQRIKMAIPALLSSFTDKLEQLNLDFSTTHLRTNSVISIIEAFLIAINEHRDAIEAIKEDILLFIELDPNGHQAGARFIVQEVLRDASPQAIEAFKDVDVESEVLDFVRIKAVAIFTLAEDLELPKYFSDRANEQITRLRAELNESEALKGDYTNILDYLKRASTEFTGEDRQTFFDFTDNFQTNPRGEDLRAAFNRLRAISYLLDPSFFNVVYRKASDMLPNE